MIAGCLRETEVENDHGDMEITLQKKRTPRYADRKEPLLQNEALQLDGQPQRSVTGCLPQANSPRRTPGAARFWLHRRFLLWLACIEESSSCIEQLQSMTDQSYTASDGS
jgi:hypothetical protein